MSRGVLLMSLVLGAIIAAALVLSHGRRASQTSESTRQSSGRVAQVQFGGAASSASDTMRRDGQVRDGAGDEFGLTDTAEGRESDSRGDGARARGSAPNVAASAVPEDASDPEGATAPRSTEPAAASISIPEDTNQPAASEPYSTLADQGSGRAAWSGGSFEVLAPATNPEMADGQEEGPGDQDRSSQDDAGGGDGRSQPRPDSIAGAANDEPHIGVVSLAVFPSRARVGDQVIVEVRIATAAKVRGAPFHLIYPQEILEYESGTVGPFLEYGTRDVVFLADGPPGRLIVALTQFGQGNGASGAGTLCKLRFRARSPGGARLSFEDAHLFIADRSEVESDFRPVDLTIR